MTGPEHSRGTNSPEGGPFIRQKLMLIEAESQLKETGLSANDKARILAALSHSLFPENDALIIRNTHLKDEKQYIGLVQSVFDKPNLFGHFSKAIAEFVKDDDQEAEINRKIDPRKVSYKIQWDKPVEKGSIGESARRVQVVLIEHATRYPNAPIVQRIVGNATCIKQSGVSLVVTKLVEQGKFPSDIKRIPYNSGGLINENYQV